MQRRNTYRNIQFVTERHKRFSSIEYNHRFLIRKKKSDWYFQCHSLRVWKVICCPIA